MEKVKKTPTPIFGRKFSSQRALSFVLCAFCTVFTIITASATDSIVITAPGNNANADQHSDLTVTVNYASNGGGYQTPIWAYRIDSTFPSYGSPHGGTQMTGSTTKQDFLSGYQNGTRNVHVALLDPRAGSP